MVAQKKFRVSSFVSDKAIKAPCIVISDVNITLSGEQTVNSVVVVAGDRVLVANQTDASENGIYDAQVSAWCRSADWDGERDVANGTIVIVAGAPLLSLYQLDVTGTFTIGTSDATFTLLATLDLAGTLASTAPGAGASQVAIEDSGGLITAADVEAALAEIATAQAVVTEWFVEKPSDTARNTTTTMANDPDLVIALPPGFFKIEAMVIFSGDTIGTQGIKVNLNYDGGVLGGRLVRTGFVNSAEIPLDFNPVRSVPSLVDFTGATIDTGPDSNVLYYNGLLETSLAGDLAVAWAQNVSDGDDVIVEGGPSHSYIRATKVG